ncbi:hypothetical protein [Paenibacillus wulumuqiensis]|uniref:hypothetical protein n=1 Tax=Paenibacillus wulumuqiensis TaxID=1567107 RepID=UPI000619DCE0|nr:hypothetical protein [Paenibacillus wulumuqiensis]
MKAFKFAILPVTLTLLLSGCSGTGTDQPLSGDTPASTAASISGNEGTGGGAANTVSIQTMEAAQAVEESSGVHYDENARMALKDTINLTFNLISAMNKNDAIYITSVAAPDVKVDPEQRSVTVDEYERPFLKGISLDNLQYRYYFPRDPQHIELAFTVVSHNETPSYELVFNYVKGENGHWLYHGHLTR